MRTPCTNRTLMAGQHFSFSPQNIKENRDNFKFLSFSHIVSPLMFFYLCLSPFSSWCSSTDSPLAFCKQQTNKNPIKICQNTYTSLDWKYLMSFRNTFKNIYYYILFKKVKIATEGRCKIEKQCGKENSTMDPIERISDIWYICTRGSFHCLLA